MSWQRVHHTPSTAYTQEWLSSDYFHDYELTPECSFSCRRASLHDRPPSASSSWALTGIITLSPSHGCELTNWCRESQHPARRPSTASQYSSKLARLRSPDSLAHRLQVYLRTRSIAASMCISKLAGSRPPGASPNSLDHSLQVYLQTHSVTASKCFTKLARSRPRSVFPNFLNYGLRVGMIKASTCISRFIRSWPPSVSQITLQYRLQVDLQTRSIMVSECISMFIRSSSPNAPRISGALVPASPDIPCVDV